MFIRFLAILTILVNFAFAFNSVDNLVVIEQNGAKKVIFNGQVVADKANLEDKINAEMDKVRNGAYGKYFWQGSSFFTNFQFINHESYKIDTEYSKVILYKNLMPVLEIEKKNRKFYNQGNLIKTERDYIIKK